jgi:hypothetical protein
MKVLLIVLFTISSFSGFAKELCLSELSPKQKYSYSAKEIRSKKIYTIDFGMSRDYVESGITEAFHVFIENGYGFTEKPQNYNICLINPEITDSNVNFIDGFYFKKIK